MATTVDAAFREWKSHLEITDRQESLVAQRRADIERILRGRLTLDATQNPLVIGSWRRNTLIAPLSQADVDLLVVLDLQAHKNWDNREGTIKALDSIRDILHDAYRNTELRRDRNCVTLHFHEFRLDVVPAFRSRSAFGPSRHSSNKSFRIPDSIRKIWVPTNPNAFAQAISETNTRMAGTFVPLIKMVKGWNRAPGSPLRSFHLEVLLHSHYNGFFGWFRRETVKQEGYRYPLMLRSFFGNLAGYLDTGSYDPMLHDRLDEYLDNDARVAKRHVAQEKAKAAHEAAKSACLAEHQHDVAQAITEWRGLMGKVFPAYG